MAAFLITLGVILVEILVVAGLVMALEFAKAVRRAGPMTWP